MNNEMSALTLGTWAIGAENYGGTNFEDSMDAIQTMIQNGVNVIDTAPAYGNGRAEKIVGEAIKGFNRSELCIATKFGRYSSISNERIVDNSFKNIMRELKSSLLNLQTDYVDYYYIHWPDNHTPISETMAALTLLKEEGLIRHIGASNFSREQIEEAECYGKIDLIQVPFSMIETKSIELMEWAKNKNMKTTTYGSLGAGILSGKIRELPKFDPNDVRVTFYDYFKEPKFSRTMELLKTIDKISNKYQKPVPQVVLNWTTQNSFVDSVIVGVVNSKEAKENCSSFEWKLEEGDIQVINEALEHLQLL